ncbi:hypothetical protein K491DRAFT_709055 [Lophiostoma macrostomum CBS 122681]|uniref:Zn(2)-C6 fungal-type domain-containing protein n=1 Tax=Lophiostoma macrostomum CBS 122681 TaxID=1314788 RepID=A0A6A6SLA7_9PLEO|nr:hypothetical protein K491DRAFT_709055 [Lophiostoma macrostomum CBS 122681]
MAQSNLSLGLTTTEEWEDLIAFDGELHDPLFQGDISFTGPGDYEPSAPPSTVDGPSSFDYVLSAPASVADDPSSFGQSYSWLSASPSFSTSATSPLPGRPTPAPQSSLGSLHACDYVSSPVQANIDNLESPLLDTGEPILGSFHSTKSFNTAAPSLFNPFLAGSPHAFNSRDVSASQALNNIGGWAEQQPRIIEPVSELDHPDAIPIPQANPFALPGAISSYPRSDNISVKHTQARAITIPQPTQRPATYNTNRPQWTQSIPPVLSSSPGLHRRPRSTTLSRSNSRTELHRNRNSLTTPSPTSNTFGWVTYQHNAQNNRLVPSGTDGSRSRRHRGRTRALTVNQRRDAALMRVIGACSNCKRRKGKCDPGIPCKACIDYYKTDLIHNPCRDRLLSDLSKVFLSDRLGWHPTARTLDSFLGPNNINTFTDISYTIPLQVGFGPELHLKVHALEIEDSSSLYHNHIIYSWPPSNEDGGLHAHAVLPAVVTGTILSSLPETLDAHLSLLVTNHFRSFPLYCSPLRILREVYIFFRSLPANGTHYRLLQQALKLLVLVHIGGDLTLPPASSHASLAQLVRTSMPYLRDENITPTPCFIRSQLGSIMPGLALSYMKSVLSSLEQLLLNRECSDWPITLAVFIVILMTIESIHYHDAKLPYHDSFDAKTVPTNRDNDKVDEESIEALFKFYSACFSGCHVRLKPDWEGEKSLTSPEDKFIESVREAVKMASPTDYLKRRANEKRSEGDMGWFFDRLVARLLILQG